MGRAQPWGVLLCCSNLLSLVGGGCMVLVCSCVAVRQGGLKRTPLFIRQLLALATSDFLLALGWLVQTGALVNPEGVPDNCTMYLLSSRFLQMLSILSVVHIAAGLLAALQRRERLLRCMAKAQLATVPCAFAISSVYLMWLPEREEGSYYCVAQKPAEAIFSSAVLIAFFTTAIIHLVATQKLMHRAPEEVAARSIKRAVHYLAAFLLTWSVFVVGCFLMPCHPSPGAPLAETVALWRNVRDTLTSASGALNAAVYAGQNWRLLWRYVRTRSWQKRRRRSQHGSRGVLGGGDASADAAVRVADGSVHSASGGPRPRGILSELGSPISTPQRSTLAPPAWRGVAFSRSVVNGEPSTMLVTPRTTEAGASAEEQISDLESRRSWLLLGADPMLLHDVRLLVQGAGCPLLDGCYDLIDCQDGRPAYRSAGGNTIRWSPEADEWQLCLGGGRVAYYQEDDAPSPPAAGWLALFDEDFPGPLVWGPSGGGTFAGHCSAAGTESAPTSPRALASRLDAVASPRAAGSLEGSTADPTASTDPSSMPFRSTASAASDALS